jgi:putative tryptophan/tyrosine transport system substrate-binding protein
MNVRRREFITLLGGAAAWPVVARAQQRAVPVIGALITPSQAEWADRMDEFRLGLGDAGFIEGRNVVIEYRWADNQLDRLPALIADLVGRKVAVIHVTGDSIVSVPMLKAATKAIPIVFTTASDPVARGLVDSLNRPGGNVTGVTSIGTELGPKQLELLHEVVPGANKIGLLVNPKNPRSADAMVQITRAAARRLGLEIAAVDAGTVEEIELAFATFARQQVGAIVLGQDAFFLARREQVAALALRHGMPTVSSTRSAAEAGALMSYGSIDSISRQAGVYVGRILHGASPGDLPIVQPTKFELVINLKTAKALGLEIAPLLLARADQVIE